MLADAGAGSRVEQTRTHGRRRVLRRGFGAASAFTLLEILLAVALLGLLSAALVSGAAYLTDGRPSSPEEIFWQASRAARKQALLSQTDVALTFDAKKMEFVVKGASATKSFPVPSARELTIDFLQGQSGSGNSSILVGGQLVQTSTLPSVTYYGDGTCLPFRAQFRGTGSARIISIDPWTCAPMLPDVKTP